MKYAVILTFVSLTAWCLWANEDPPYHVSDPAIAENFNVIYFMMANHRHSNDDSSKPFDWLPDSSTVYDLGNSTSTWRNLYINGIKTAFTVSGGSVTIANPFGLQVGTMAIVAQGSGNVGIGTLNPSSKFDLNGGSITIRGANAGLNITGGPATGGALCLNAGGNLSKCTSVVDISGNCTCP